MTPEEKITCVEEQVNRSMHGLQDFIDCPYCSKRTSQSDHALCCADLGLTIRAILRRQAQQDCLAAAAEVLEAVDKAGMN